MKIICIEDNYIENPDKFINNVNNKPVFFIKPESSLLIRNRPFFYPDFSNEISCGVELVLKINKLGKNIQDKFANTYYNEIAVGIDFTAQDLMRKCRQKGLPWDIAKSFDYSAPISKFIPKTEFKDIKGINFYLNINGNLVQKGNSKNMIFSFDEIISYVSQFITLKTGDLIFTGILPEVGNIKIKDILEAFIEDKKLLYVKIK